MFPLADTLQYQRAEKLMRMERELFSSWCSLVFRPASSNQVRMFVKDLDRVDEELRRTASPWFLDDFSIVDLTYIT
jgi:glutathione S-transferase